MFDQSNWEKPALYSQRLARWPDERTEKQFNAEYKKNTKLGFHAEASWQMPLLIKKSIKGRLEHAKIHLDRPVKFWKNVLLSDVTKRQQYVWCKKGKAYEQKNTISMIKHGGGPVLLRGCFAVAGSEHFDCMKDIMDSLKYQAKNLDAFDAETEAW